MFATLRDGDVLVHHPYESFATSVQRFIEQAAADPNVLAIKQTLYRTSGDSPIVDALIDAAEAGKQVVALVEIKARFDEQANIKWARALERAGCHVVYGLVGLKTHCKTALVVRQEGGAIRRYCHIGTGNYNPKTARLYEDLGLFTADPDDRRRPHRPVQRAHRLLAADRRTARCWSRRTASAAGLIERIEREIAHARAGRPARIRIKMQPTWSTSSVIDALYRASQAGVPVESAGARHLHDPGRACPGCSENITVRSILGRFLEHSRIFYFANDGDPEYWIGSADLMHRNLDRRVEVLVQVKDKAATDRMAALLETIARPDTRGWELGPDGWVPSPERRHPAGHPGSAAQAGRRAWR